MEKIKKELRKIFTDGGLNITIETTLHITEYLDVTFNLKTGKYYAHTKQNNSLHYIPNHPPSMIKRIPSMVSKWLSHISSDKEHIDKDASIYNEVLKNNGFDETLKVSHIIPTRRHRGRNIT